MAIISIPNSIGGLSVPGALLNGPLSSLFGNKYDVQNLKYPRDLESATRGHLVKFNINEVEPIGYQEGTEYSLNTALNGIGNAAANAVKSGVDSLSSFLPNSVSDFLGKNLPGDGKTKFNLSLEPSKKRLAATVSLYMPDSVNFGYHASYGTLNLADVAKNTLENLPGIKANKAGKMITGALESDVGKLALKSQGLAINPNQQLLFDGLELRSYSMSFTFTPYSKQEAQTVQKIIKTFKEYSRPRTVKDTAGMLFIPPSTFELEFLFNGKANPYISKVAESVIENVEVNYTPAGWSTHTDGSPVQTTMTLSFKEIKLIDRAHVQAGY
jgi:hypothetical protein